MQRSEQVWQDFVRKVLQENGRVPYQDDQITALRDLYQPSVDLLLPQKNAVSNPDAFRSTLRSLFANCESLSDAFTAVYGRLRDLRLAARAERDKVVQESLYALRILQILRARTQVKNYWAGDLPRPVSPSQHVVHEGDIRLEPNVHTTIEYSIKEIARQADRYYSVDTWSLPYTQVLRSDTSNQVSVQINLSFLSTYVSTLELQSTPCTVTLYTPVNQAWKQIWTGENTRSINIPVYATTNQLLVEFTVDQSEATLVIDQLRLLHQTYATAGWYYTGPLPLKGSGDLQLHVDHDIPEGTSIEYRVATDRQVQAHLALGTTDESGNFTILEEPVSPERPMSQADPAFEIQLVSGEYTRWISELNQYPLLTQQVLQPDWQSAMPETDLRYNYRVVGLESGDYVTSPDLSGESVQIAQLADPVLPEPEDIAVRFGRDAWLFYNDAVPTLRTTNAGDVVTDAGTGRRWATYFTVTAPATLTVTLPESGAYSSVRNYFLYGLDGQYLHESAAPPSGTYTTPTLDPGLYQMTFVMEHLNAAGADWDYTVADAIDFYDGFNPLDVVSLSGDIEAWISPTALPLRSQEHLEHYALNRDLVRYAVTDSGGILVPRLHASGQYDLAHPTLTMETLYASPETINQLYEVTYRQPEQTAPSTTVFVSARLTTTNPQVTPSIRSLELSLG